MDLDYWNMLNSRVMFTFSVSYWKSSFWANLVEKIKVISLSWSLVPRLIEICRSLGRCLFFLLLTGSILFWKICSKKSKTFLEVEIWTWSWSSKLFVEYAEFDGDFIFLFFILEMLFLGYLLQKFKIVSLS